MNPSLTLLAVLLLAPLAFPGFARSANAQETRESFEAAARGFGDVRVELRTYRQSEQQSSWTTFQAEDAVHARIIGSKRLADLLGFGDLKPVADSKLPGTVLELKAPAAGCWASKTTASTNSSPPTKTSLASWRSPPRRRPGPLSPNAPTRAGWTASTTPVRASGGAAAGDGGHSFRVPVDEGTRPGVQLPPAQRGPLCRPGRARHDPDRLVLGLAARFDIPFRVHCWEQKPAWLWNRVPLPYVRRGPGYGPGRFGYPNNAEHSLFSIPYGSEPVSASDPYAHDFRRRFMENLNRDPNFLGSKAVAEIPNAGVEVLAAVAGMPETEAYWHCYLVRVLGLDLPKVGLLHHGRRDFYRSWEQVDVPLPRDFLGHGRRKPGPDGALGGSGRPRLPGARGQLVCSGDHAGGGLEAGPLQ